jgi:DNA-binding NarL/FixJ family response regulator
METPTAESISVYLVEDSPLIRERLFDLLVEIDGVSIVGVAESETAATAEILRDRPDTVVLDLRLAEGNGMNVLRKVHTQAPEITFIVLTAFDNPQYRDACMKCGASYFFDKSSQIPQVRTVIAARVAARRLLSALQTKNEQE